MARQIIIIPSAPPAVASSRTSRRDVLGAIGFSGLAAVAVAGFVRPDGAISAVPAPGPDAALLAACAAFEAAHHAQTVASVDPSSSDQAIVEVSEHWNQAADSVISAPAPRTEAGRIALAHAARTALVDMITGNGDAQLAAMATREETMALAALDSMRGVGA